MILHKMYCDIINYDTFKICIMVQNTIIVFLIHKYCIICTHDTAQPWIPTLLVAGKL